MIRKFKAKEARAKKVVGVSASTSTDLVILATSPLIPQRGPDPDLESAPDAALVSDPQHTPTAYVSDFGMLGNYYNATEFPPMEVVRRCPSPIPAFSLAPTIEDQATAYFVTNYVVNTGGPTRGHLDYITKICGEDGDFEGLICSMKAVGLAGFAHRSQAPSLFKNARYQYWKALQATNEALRSPVRAKKDSTISAIMILGIYETITGSRQTSIRDWAEHVKGAAALLKLRGREQLRTVRGRRMFIQVASSLMIVCIHQRTPLPEYILEWTAEAKSYLTNPEPAILVQETMMRFTGWRASVADGTNSDPHEILKGALELDNDFVHLFSTCLPLEWAYETIYTDAKSDVIWNGRYHVYYDYWISQMWNAMRTIRILLNEDVRTLLMKGFAAKPPVFTKPEHYAQLQTSTNILFEMQEDILATTPQHLGYVKPNEARRANLQLGSVEKVSTAFPWNNFRDFTGHGEPVVRMTGPYFLLWPLFLAGVVDVATPDVKKFVVKNLRAIGESMGIKQAMVLANAVETSSHVYT